MIMPSEASELVEILDTVTQQDESRTVIGRLPGGDLDDQRFHIVEDAPAGVKPREYRGAVDPALRGAFEHLHYGQRVRATIVVTYTDSPFTAAPSESYALVAVEPINETGSDDVS